MHEQFGSPPSQVRELIAELEDCNLSFTEEDGTKRYATDEEKEAAIDQMTSGAFTYIKAEKERFRALYLVAANLGIYPGFSDPDDWADPIPTLGADGNIVELTPEAREQAAEAVGRISGEHSTKHNLRHHPWCGWCHTKVEELNRGEIIEWEAASPTERDWAAYCAEQGIPHEPMSTMLESAREQLVKRAAVYLAVSPEPIDAYDPANDSEDISAADLDIAWQRMKRQSAKEDSERALLVSSAGEITRGDLYKLEAPTGEVVQVESVESFDALDEVYIADALRKLKIREEAKRRHEADEAPDPGTFDTNYLDLDQLDGLPTPEPLIEGILSRHTYSLLRGRDGTYKSFVALDWALCLAAGKPWQGRESQSERVLYIAGEGAYGIAARVKAWSSAWQTDVDPSRFTLRTASVNMLAGGPEFEDLLKRVTEGGYGLVVVDTLRRASGSAEENGSEMGIVIDNLDRVKRATKDGSVLVIAHTQKADLDIRGFSGIEDDADTIWHCKRDAESQALTVVNTKEKDGPDGTKFDLTAKPVLGSLILFAGVVDAFAGTRPSEEKILNVLADTFALTNGATAKEIMAVTGISESGFYNARGELLKQGKIDSTKVGSATRFSIRHSTGTPPTSQGSDLQDSTDSS